MKLFIVESPKKAKTISKFLGKGWIVKATVGHIKDLPSKELGIDESNFEPKFVWLEGKYKLIQEIKKIAYKADEILIGTDPDREGEAIAKFVYDELAKTKKPISRVVFYEITPKSIFAAIKNKRDIDYNLVNAQIARRVLDRLIGYKLSPELWKHLNNNKLSVGRVQSPAVKIIVDREEEIKNFDKKEYYHIKLLFNIENKKFYAYSHEKFDKKEEAEKIAKELESADIYVKEYQEWEEKKAPPAPFTTSTLQTTANVLYKISTEEVQKIAQNLYESGLITYPRTDSYRINKEMVETIKEYIKKEYGEEYVGYQRKYKQSKNAQGAHECIRMVDVNNVLPDDKSKQKLVYDLIYSRTLASLASDAILKKQKIIFIAKSNNNKVNEMTFESNGNKIVFDGYLRIYHEKIEEIELPKLKADEKHKPEEIDTHKVVTQPPPRFSEGTLVKKLEQLGIGRPSTYATIMKNIKNKGYIIQNKNILTPTEIAYAIIKFLKENYPMVIDYDLTKKMEDQLDLIETGTVDWKHVAKTFFYQMIQNNHAY